MIRAPHITLTLIVLGVLSQASRASSLTLVTYDFTATLGQAVGGSNQISGSFTFYELMPPILPGSSGSQGPNANPITLNFANASTTTDASARNSIEVEAGAGGSPLDSFGVTSYGYGDGLSINGQRLSVGIWLVNPSGGVFTGAYGENTPTLNLADFPEHTIDLEVGTLSPVSVTGVLTSLQLAGTSDGSSIPPAPTLPPPTPTPEPSTLAVFGLLGLVAIPARRRSLRANASR